MVGRERVARNGAGSRSAAQKSPRPSPFVGGSVPRRRRHGDRGQHIQVSRANGKGFIRVFQAPRAGHQVVTVDGDDAKMSRSICLRDRLTTFAWADRQIDRPHRPVTTRAGHRSRICRDSSADGSEGWCVPRRSFRCCGRSGRLVQDEGDAQGRYTATALEWVRQGRQFVPSFQEQLRRAGKTFTLIAGEPATID